MRSSAVTFISDFGGAVGFGLLGYSAYRCFKDSKGRPSEIVRAVFVKPPFEVTRSEHVSRVWSLPKEDILPYGNKSYGSEDNLAAFVLEGSWKRELVFRDVGKSDAFLPTHNSWSPSVIEGVARKAVVEGNYTVCLGMKAVVAGRFSPSL